MNPSIFPCWAIVSQMGHRTTAGHVTIDTTLGVPPGLDKEPAPTGEPKPAEVLDRATGPGTDGASDGERVVGCPDGVLCRLNGCTPDHCNVVPF